MIDSLVRSRVGFRNDLRPRIGFRNQLRPNDAINRASTIRSPGLHWRYRCLVLLVLLISSLAVTACAPEQGSVHTRTGVPGATTVSTATFTLSGETNGTYRISSGQTTSKLRHGHREFTIFLSQAPMSFIIAFYGYDGPGAYTLSNGVNGGDVRIHLSKQATWDLSLRPHDSCALVVSSDIPTRAAGLDHMQGTFSCPVLYPPSTQAQQGTVRVSQGHFDILIIVES